MNLNSTPSEPKPDLPIRTPGKSGTLVGGERQPVPQRS